jgi:hypothetical protein
VGGACGTHGSWKETVESFGRKPEGKRHLGKSRRRWENGIRMDLREISMGEWMRFN